MVLRVYGDVTIDNYEYRLDVDYTGEDRVLEAYERELEFEPEMRPTLGSRVPTRFVARQFGGAYLLIRKIAVALTLWSGKNPEEMLDQREPWKTVSKVLRNAEETLNKEPSAYDDVLRLFYRISEDPDGCYRVGPHGYEGFTLPTSYRGGHELFGCVFGEGSDAPSCRSLPVLAENEKGATVCVFNDGGTGLTRKDINDLNPQEWRKTAGDVTWAIVKGRRVFSCLASGAGKRAETAVASEASFYRKLEKSVAGNLVYVVNADDLARNHAAISRSLSWERSIRDLVAQIERVDADGNRSGIFSSWCPPHFIVTFDCDAAAYLEIKPGKGKKHHVVSKVVFVFSTNRSEGEYLSQFHGSMPGAQTVFMSVFAGLLHNRLVQKGAEFDEGLVEAALTYGLIAKQRTLKSGFEPIEDGHRFVQFHPRKRAEDKSISYAAPGLWFHESVFALPDPKGGPKGPPLNRKASSILPVESNQHEFRDPLPKPADSGVSKRLDLSQCRKDQQGYDLTSIRIPRRFLDKKQQDQKEQDFFTIISEALTKYHNGDLNKPLIDYVLTGRVKDIDGAPLPICNIGKIKTISEKEISSLRGMRRLVLSYLNDRHTHNPMGVVVLGPPGTGKSFTVKSIFDTLTGPARDLIHDAFIECNLSGLGDPDDLADTFQRARDLRLNGKVPVLFFDEFDCTVDGQHYFWLKHFLAPLQDGEFTARHATHPIGKSIFVFAGGLNETYKELRDRFIGYDGLPLKYGPLAQSKGADFLSRLQGRIDIEGLSPPKGELGQERPDISSHPEYPRYAMKRAIVLRDLLKIFAKTIFSGAKGDKAEIDRRIVRAFLEEGRFAHGVRSMEAVIRMSTLSEAGRFTPECLPISEQLEMHVSAEFHKRAFGRL